MDPSWPNGFTFGVMPLGFSSNEVLVLPLVIISGSMILSCWFWTSCSTNSSSCLRFYFLMSLSCMILMFPFLWDAICSPIFPPLDSDAEALHWSSKLREFMSSCTRLFLFSKICLPACYLILIWSRFSMPFICPEQSPPFVVMLMSPIGCWVGGGI